MINQIDKMRENVLGNFFDSNGMLKSIPSQKKKKLIILEYIVNQLDSLSTYTESELNVVIQRYHADFCTIRREFIINGFMEREGGIYRLRDKEYWKNWQDL